MIKNFEYNDIVLYSKGWYQRSKSIYEDLGYLFSKIYAWTPRTPEEVAPFMLRVLDKLREEMGIEKFHSRFRISSFYSFNDEVVHRMTLQDISYNEAIVLTVMSILQELSKDEIQLNPPHYGKHEHFRMGMFIGEWPKSMTYKEMNKRAQEAFKIK
jgi:hypothetical protein